MITVNCKARIQGIVQRFASTQRVPTLPPQKCHVINTFITPLLVKKKNYTTRNAQERMGRARRGRKRRRALSSMGEFQLIFILSPCSLSQRQGLIRPNLKVLPPPPNAGVTGMSHHTSDTILKSYTARVPYKRAPCEKDSDTDTDHKIYTPPPLQR